MTSKTEISRYDVMDMWIRSETAVVREMFDLACPLTGTMDRDEASRLRQEAFTRNAVLYRLVNTMADDALLVAMGFDPADFDETGQMIGIRAILQGEVVAVDAGSDCCGKWAVHDVFNVVSCSCARPAVVDTAAIDEFIDDYDALFGQRLAA